MPSVFVKGSRYRRLPSCRIRVCPFSFGVLRSLDRLGFVGCKTWDVLGLDMAKAYVSLQQRQVMICEADGLRLLCGAGGKA